MSGSHFGGGTARCTAAGLASGGGVGEGGLGEVVCDGRDGDDLGARRDQDVHGAIGHVGRLVFSEPSRNMKRFTPVKFCRGKGHCGVCTAASPFLLQLRVVIALSYVTEKKY